jgi:hypothetical protein
MPAACSVNKAIKAGVAVAESGNAALSLARSRKSYARGRLRRNRRQAIFRRATLRKSLHMSASASWFSEQTIEDSACSATSKA